MEELGDKRFIRIESSVAKSQVNTNPESFNSFNMSEIKGYISGCNGDMNARFTL